MNMQAMLRVFCDAVEQRNGAAFADLFTEDGVYHDVFYGAFAGRAKIAAAQKARWAKINSGKPAAKAAAKPVGKKNSGKKNDSDEPAK